MSNKLFHVTNDESLLSGIHFSPEFADLRIRGKKKWIINEKCKKALEDSIVRGKLIVDCGNGANSCQNDNSVG
jgi:hypothetical protein